jgi:hypothetical protein
LPSNERRIIFQDLHVAYDAALGRQPARTIHIMRFKLFRKSSESRPRFEQDSSLAEALARRVSGIDFQPSKGFLKDQHQPKRSRPQSNWVRK